VNYGGTPRERGRVDSRLFAGCNGANCATAKTCGEGSRASLVGGGRSATYWAVCRPDTARTIRPFHAAADSSRNTTDYRSAFFHDGYASAARRNSSVVIKGGTRSARTLRNDALLREWDAHPDLRRITGAPRSRRGTSTRQDATCHAPIGSSWFVFMWPGLPFARLQKDRRPKAGRPPAARREPLSSARGSTAGYPKSNKIGDLLFPGTAQFRRDPPNEQWFTTSSKAEAPPGIEKEVLCATT